MRNLLYAILNTVVIAVVLYLILFIIMTFGAVGGFSVLFVGIVGIFWLMYEAMDRGYLLI